MRNERSRSANPTKNWNIALHSFSPALVAGVLASVARIALAAITPVVPNMSQIFDDLLLVRYADSIHANCWLGAYDKMTLAKNPGYSLLLQIPALTGISFQILFMTAFTLSCVLFVLAIRPLIPSQRARLVIFVLFLFLPPMLTYEMFQRVYRMGIAIPFVIAVFSSYIALYLRRDEPAPRLVPWYLCAAFGLGSFYYLKEDSVWALPFVTVVSAILALYWIVLIPRKKAPLAANAIKIALLALPLACTLLVGQLIRTANQRAYGVATTCERTDTGFTSFVGQITAIDSEDNDLDVWLTKRTLEQACAASPTLNRIAPEIETAFNAWKGDGDYVFGDIAFWALRDAYELSGGYADAQETSEYWQKAADELEAAFDSGKLKRKEGLKISALVPPLPSSDIPRLVSRCLKNTKVILSLSLARVNTGTGDGTLEHQEMASRLMRGPITLSTATYPLPLPQRIGLKASDLLLAIEKTLAWPLIIITCIAFAALIFVSFFKGFVDGRHTLLIVVGLVLSCAVLIIAVSWDILYLERTDTVEWAAYMYCSACYPLLFMGGALTLCVLGRAWTLLLPHAPMTGTTKASESGARP